MTNTEGGTDDEEFRVAAIKDRVDTTMQVWMGLTMGCAKCHSHKYDPLTNEEYYKFYAIFNQTADTDQPDESPVIAGGHGRDQQSDPQGQRPIAELNEQLEHAAAAPELVTALAKWQSSRIRRSRLTPAARKDIPKAILAILDTPPARRTKEQVQATGQALPLDRPELKPIRDADCPARKGTARDPDGAGDGGAAQGQAAGHESPSQRELPRSRGSCGTGRAQGTPPPALPSGGPVNRLVLAKWLVDRKNPLTARVAVNRYWAQLFGAGIVETEEDFGTQGELPSHPALLDWLAVRYMESGWDTKAMLKLIVTSATYRQSSRVTPELLPRDPRNRLLARAPRVRLEAEMVRDQALALSGLLSPKIGGPSVFPPQPEGLWQAAFNGQRTWATSQGSDKYRRALYTFWRRTVPYPSMATFDAPSREICAIKRVRTNTPLQAFVTLNDPVYVEAAQALARRVVREGGSNLEDRVHYALQLCLCRPPRPEQVEQLIELYQGEHQRYQKNHEAARGSGHRTARPAARGYGPRRPGCLDHDRQRAIEPRCRLDQGMNPWTWTENSI